MKRFLVVLMIMLVGSAAFATPLFTKCFDRYAVILEEGDTVKVYNITVENKSKGQKLWFIDGMDNGNFTIYDVEGKSISRYDNIECNYSEGKVVINEAENK